MTTKLAARILADLRSPRSWLIVALFALLLLALPARSDESRIYDGTALIEIAAESELLPTAAILVNGELECSSVDAFAIILSCAAGMIGAVDSDNAIIAEQMRVEARLDCPANKEDQVVNTIMIYNIVFSNHPLDSRTIAKIRLKRGDVRYVRTGALEF